MKWRVISYITVATLGVTLTLGQKAPRNTPQYDVANEVTFKGVVEEVREFQCPVSGALDGHITVKADDGKTFLVHLASPKFLKEYGISFAKATASKCLEPRPRWESKKISWRARSSVGTKTFCFETKTANPCGSEPVALTRRL